MHFYFIRFSYACKKKKIDLFFSKRIKYLFTKSFFSFLFFHHKYLWAWGDLVTKYFRRLFSFNAIALVLLSTDEMKRKSLKTIKYHFIKCWVKYYRLQNISSSTAINVWIKYILYLISTATPAFEWQKCLWRRVVKQRWDERWLLRSIITREKMLMAFDGSKTIFPSLNLLDWKLHKNNFPLNKRRILNERSCGPVNNVLPFNLFSCLLLITFSPSISSRAAFFSVMTSSWWGCAPRERIPYGLLFLIFPLTPKLCVPRVGGKPTTH